MDRKINLTSVFEKADEGGYIAYIEEIPGVNTQGETLEEVKENLFEALELVLEVNIDIDDGLELREEIKEELRHYYADKESGNLKVIEGEEIFKKIRCLVF